ncbi:MAG: RHS repeat-associated core domain-containing protein [Rhodopseudomonas palustris]|nr:RHS repeat-associated core domain-containing protein [Rhodopseudomonas palustris]
MTDSSGTVVYSAMHDPFGGILKEWVNTHDPVLKFSGKERDRDTGLDDFGARWYASRHMRFMTVDPILNKPQALLNPQYWNGYAYCLNNPVNVVDPDGRSPLEVMAGVAAYLTVTMLAPDFQFDPLLRQRGL